MHFSITDHQECMRSAGLVVVGSTLLLYLCSWVLILSQVSCMARCMGIGTVQPQWQEVHIWSVLWLIKLFNRDWLKWYRVKGHGLCHWLLDAKYSFIYIFVFIFFNDLIWYIISEGKATSVGCFHLLYPKCILRALVCRGWTGANLNTVIFSSCLSGTHNSKHRGMN